MLNKNNFFFIGIGGAGMSAIAQYLSFIGKKVSGSDRIFNDNKQPKIKTLLENENITCYQQDGSGLNKNIDVVVVSTAIENKVREFSQAKLLGLEIIHRAELLQLISENKKTIAISGTSGKSTTVAMLFHILHNTEISPSLINNLSILGSTISNVLFNGMFINCINVTRFKLKLLCDVTSVALSVAYCDLIFK